jgi:transcription elongation factor GreB
MNKAFTKESDDEPDDAESVPRSAQLPAGTPNYVTADGAERMRDEMNRLLNHDTGVATGELSDAEVKRRRLRSEQRIAYLKQCLRTAVPMTIPANTAGAEAVRFGAYVTVKDGIGEEFVYRIVGVDEIDLNRGWISWLSPIAAALMNAKVGETISFRTPKGDERLQVAHIAYL